MFRGDVRREKASDMSAVARWMPHIGFGRAETQTAFEDRLRRARLVATPRRLRALSGSRPPAQAAAWPAASADARGVGRAGCSQPQSA